MSAFSGAITTVTGDGNANYAGDGGPAQAGELNQPFQIAFDSSDNLYIADTLNMRVRRVDFSTGAISTVAGNGEQATSGDGGPAIGAALDAPIGLVVDLAGNLYISELLGNRIRKVDPAGIITTLAGNGNAGYLGDGGTALAAEFNAPGELSLDGAGHLYVADAGNNRVRRIDLSTGIIKCVAGAGDGAYSGDSGPPLAADLYGATGVGVNVGGDLYIADTNNSRVRKVSTSYFVTSQKTAAVLWPPPSPIAFGSLLSSAQLDATASVPGVFSYVPSIGASLPLGSNTLSVTFTPSDSSYATNTSTTTITVLRAAPVVTWPTPGPIRYGMALSALQLNASATIPGIFSYSPAAGMILDVGTTALNATFTPTDLTNYAPSTSTVSLTVTKGTPALSWNAPGMVPLGTVLSTVQLDATASVPGTFVYNPALGTILGNTGKQTLSVVFTPSDASNYTVNTQSITISVGNQTELIFAFAGNGTAGYTGDGGLATAAQLSVGQLINDPSGNVYFIQGSEVRKINSSTGIISTFAGTAQQGYNGNGGQAVASQLLEPESIVFDSNGDLLIADTGNCMIRRVSSASGVISLVAGLANSQGNEGICIQTSDGTTADAATLNRPSSLAVDRQGLIYFSENGSIRQITSAGILRTVISGYIPTSLAFDSKGDLYIAQIYTIFRMDAISGSVSICAGYPGDFSYQDMPPGDEGLATQAIVSASQIAFDSSNNMFVADVDNSLIRRIDFASGIITTVAGHYDPSNYVRQKGYSGDGGSAVEALLNTPYGVSVDHNGTIYVADSKNSVVRRVAMGNAPASIIWPQPVEMAVGTPLSSLQLNATANTPGTFVYTPASGTILSVGTVSLTVTFKPDDISSFAAATATQSVYVYQPVAQTTTIVWSSPASITYGTPLASSQLNAIALASGQSVTGSYVYSPSQGTILPVGTHKLLVTFTPKDAANYTTATSSVNLVVGGTSSDRISTVAGNGHQGYTGDGGIATSSTLNGLASVAVDLVGNLYVADTVNNVVRKVSASTGIIATIAGDGTRGFNGFSGDGGAATSAKLAAPTSVTVDATGNVYIAEYWGMRLRRVDATTGLMSTVINNPGYNGNIQVAVNASGDVYFTGLQSVVCKRSASNGSLSTVAGTGSQGYSGDGGAAIGAALNSPSSLAVDTANNLYIVDSGNYVIREVNASTGIISTIAGNGTTGSTGGGSGSYYQTYSPDGGLATNARLDGVGGIAVDAEGNLYIADTKDDRIREVTAVDGIINTLSGNGVSAYFGDGGAATNAEFTSIGALALDLAGVIFVGDTGDYVIREIVGRPRTLVVVNWPNLLPISVGTTLGPAQLDASVNGIAGTFAYSPGLGTTLPLGPQILSVVFTPTDTAHYDPVSASATLMVNSLATPSINWQTPAAIAYGSELTARQLDATANIPGAFSYNPGIGTRLNAGTQALSAVFTPTDTLSYNPVAVQNSLMVNQGMPVVAWPPPNPIIYGTALSSIQLNATSSIQGTFSYSPGFGTILPAGQVSLSVVFIPADNAYATVTASTSLTVEAAAPAATIAAILPDPAAVGGTVTITGTGFGAAQGVSTVTFNGVLALPTSWTNTAITLAVPSGATTGNVVVWIGNNPSNKFLLMVPVICHQ